MTLELQAAEEDRIVEMAWEDKTPFEAIKIQFQVSEQEVIQLMRRTLKPASFRRWRRRVHAGISQKHIKKRSSQIARFKSDQQRAISQNRISKRGHQ